MNTEYLVAKALTQFFAMPFERRRAFLQSAAVGTAYVYDHCGTTESNPLKFLTLSFQSLLSDRLEFWKISDATLVDELNAVLSAMIFLPENQSYVWLYEVDPKTYGVAGELWLIVERLSLLLCAQLGWQAGDPGLAFPALVDALGEIL